MRAILVLWDIDHTLIENHGVNKETYALTFELMTGHRAEHPAMTEGRTEPEIMRNLLRAHGIEPDNEHDLRMPSALESATSSNAGALRERGHELPGARKALVALKARPNIVQSVLSGNIRANALTKLAVFGLDGYMDFEAGGYGSDDEVRANLVSVAQKRAAEKYGLAFNKSNTILIGDTLRDVQAGRHGGAHVIAVASGSDSMGSLREEGADVVLPDLQDTQAVVDAILSLADLGVSTGDCCTDCSGPLAPEVRIFNR
jgi:phosphoglycolate phosphatase